MSFEPVISVRGLSKIYQVFGSPKDRLWQMLSLSGKRRSREFTVLRDLSLELARGQTIGIIGRNGAGKSTLLQMICGTLIPTRGDIFVRGRVAALLELGAGFNPEFSGRENVLIAAALYGLTLDQISQRLSSILAFADIGDFVDQPVKTYSSGMFVRLAFAVIAHVDADVLVVDEALAVGDVFFQQKCMRFLRDFQVAGGTMLFVSHDTSAVVNLCQSALWLKNPSTGDYVLGPADEVCKAYLQDFYAQQAGVARAAVSDLATPVPSAGITHYVSDALADNLIEFSPFNSKAESFGSGGAQFQSAGFFDAQGQPLQAVRGGDPVVLRLIAVMHKDVIHPAFGITVKDRLGQFIISEGSDAAFRSSNLAFARGDTVTVDFSFRMPILLQGHYTLDIAIAEGLGNDHIQHHWMHDAIALTSLQGRLVQGISGLPDLTIDMRSESASSEPSA